MTYAIYIYIHLICEKILQAVHFVRDLNVGILVSGYPLSLHSQCNSSYGPSISYLTNRNNHNTFARLPCSNEKV